MKAISFGIVYLVPISAILGYLLGGIFTFLTPFFVFVAVPLLDTVLGYNYDNPKDENEDYLEKKKSFRILTWLAMPVSLFLVIWGSYIISIGNVSILEFFGLTISVGINSGVLGINSAHEMQHRVNKKLEPVLARLTLLPSLYIHWGLEHVVWHHRWVATSKDPATAKLNQSFYSFWLQTVFGSFKSAWNFEKNKLIRKGYKSTLVRNRIFHYIIYEILFSSFILLAFGFFSLLFFVFQSIISLSLLEIINYIEHYGLLREKDSDGNYKSVKPYHSWNSSKRLTNWFLFNLQRHSDHHYKPGRRYQILRHFDEAPQLPTGYAGMILIALIPPLFKKIINPRITELKCE
ncbi:MAG: alkane 1-monooxygenase [Candidatus Lokiarchaeota archaeon]|nr:alkane 1-monooxygenase [Candidatus Lokiarchaeota archaeon]MBD3200232.1 alkane 1-monooxygenase [Candidatus Lokiarchaeota archaeon]